MENVRLQLMGWKKLNRHPLLQGAGDAKSAKDGKKVSLYLGVLRVWAVKIGWIEVSYE